MLIAPKAMTSKKSYFCKSLNIQNIIPVNAKYHAIGVGQKL